MLTGSGHFFTESFELIHGLEHCDIFVSKAANEVMRMYKLKLDFPETMRVLHDKTASAMPVGEFYHGVYHTVVVAPATFEHGRQMRAAAFPTRLPPMSSPRPANAACRRSSLPATPRRNSKPWRRTAW